MLLERMNHQTIIGPCVGLSIDDFSHHAIAYLRWQVEGRDLPDFFGSKTPQLVRRGRLAVC
jgi:hypothetical protein